MLGNPLGRAGVSPCAVGTTAVCTLGRPVWAQAASPHSTPLNRASALHRGVLPCAGRAPGTLGLVVGGDVTPLLAPWAKHIWSHLLVGVDLVAAPRSRIPLLHRRLSTASPRTAATTDDLPHRSRWKRALTLAPLSHLMSAGTCTPDVLRFELLPELPKASTIPHVLLQRHIVDADPLLSLLWHNVGDVAENRTCRLQHHFSAL